MKTLLIILSKHLSQEEIQSFLPVISNTHVSISVLLIQEGALLQQSPWEHTYVLNEDSQSENQDVLFPQVSYHDMVQMIFSTDTVIAI